MEELPSLGVGRIRSLFMYPMSFDEYLNSLNLSSLVEKIAVSSAEKTMSEPLHKQCLNHKKSCNEKTNHHIKYLYGNKHDNLWAKRPSKIHEAEIGLSDKNMNNADRGLCTYNSEKKELTVEQNGKLLTIKSKLLTENPSYHYTYLVQNNLLIY